MKEKTAWHVNGFGVFLLSLLMTAGAIACFVYGAPRGSGLLLILGIWMLLLVFIALTSMTIVQPNEAKVLTFFGKYMGTVRESGLWMVLPLTGKSKLSVKVRNFNSQKLKVNDAEGNPIEIAAVVVFRVVDTAKAKFDVDDYETFVEIQSETAIRHIAAQYPYDTFSEQTRISLRANADEVSAQMLKELQSRLEAAGVEVLETRLTHLAYAPEIANAMLQRQQAAAIVSARQIIVEGAVGMVDMALQRLAEKGIELDSERRAAMVNNLMVTIVSDRASTPVINTGTLYN